MTGANVIPFPDRRRATTLQRIAHTAAMLVVLGICFAWLWWWLA